MAVAEVVVKYLIFLKLSLKRTTNYAW